MKEEDARAMPLRELLLRCVLSRIPVLTQPVAGRIAAAASSETREGKLLVLVCDSWNIAISRVARDSGMADVDVSRFAAGLWEPGQKDVERMKLALARMMPNYAD